MLTSFATLRPVYLMNATSALGGRRPSNKLNRLGPWARL